MKKKYLIIADDLTGSNDSGVQMKKRGIPVDVLLFPKKGSIDNSIVLDTESRNLPKEDAFQKVKRLTSEVLEYNQFDIVYKKVDSTLRGNIAVEVKAVCDIYKPTKVVFAPAYPKIGRTTQNKIHMLSGTPLMQTEVANDPLSPIKTDNIVELLENELKVKVIHHSQKSLYEDVDILNGGVFHTFDILTTADILKLASILINTNERILYVGSAGLTEGIFENIYPVAPVLSVVGSISEASRNQMNYAEKNGVEVIQIDIESIFDKKRYPDYTEKIVDALNSKKDVILTACRTREEYAATIAYAEKQKGLSKIDSSTFVQNSLSSITKGVLESVDVSGLFLTGGDTAIAVIDKLEGTGCTIEAEVLTGIIKSKLIGGKYDGTNLITKAGAFGKEEDLLYCIGKLKEK
ncbi:four-carbon acid sugar kinase family protein [Caldifermentibacillus hisashii]|uniref:4-hydroxythreonine-4-phosphate dehydrogenase n=2 Tax=Bacillaceae TaxID=186817 RepID=A0A090KVD5_9BACI|nr:MULTISPECIES: four-carbon acid sugar kinase family protein [Bacillaceae]KIO67062.1 hypothetical protein B4065_2093 [Caldibacillus thermoamylovorans]MCM3053643.1 four-carbon acid sugar kinase family protein [Caldibacillus thermoamylovorans]MDL0421253.1 four-carbon acid sugar kinase family protein [Caldibacillus thermoamylovorans]MED3641886.1 four-carbon acid sugar kinase family protein [Caldifermentibacillus hisashii]CEE02689.1 4-hydroxythreonine-4-phosphate dehydrogenase [Caldibacillus ther